MPTEQYLATALLLLVSVAAVNDLASRRIPNRLLLLGLACALLLRLLSASPGTAVLMALGGTATGFGIFLPFYLLRGMAAGDVKLMAVVGAFTGPEQALEIAVLAWCAGGVMALSLVVLRGRLGLTLRNLGTMLVTLLPGAPLPMQAPQTSAGSMPYGVAIAAGTMLFLVRSYG
jgi:prepilin peptidase CpaA